MKEGPQRTCIACRQVRAKAELVRLVRGGDGQVMVDVSRAGAGRGAYACPTVGCLEQALAPARLARAFKSAVKPPRATAVEVAESWRRR